MTSIKFQLNQSAIDSIIKTGWIRVAVWLLQSKVGII